MDKNRKKFKKIYNKIAVLFIVVLLSVLVFKALSDGIKINEISIANVKIEGLYLKLNEKLILRIKNIDINTSRKDSKIAKNATPKALQEQEKKDTPKIADIANMIKYAITLTSFFEKFHIKNINYGGESSSVFFDGNQYKVNMPYVNAIFNLQNLGSDILLSIEMLKVKNENLDLKGRILWLEDGDIFAFDIESYINNRTDNAISYQGQTDFKHLNIVLDSTKLTSIDVLEPYIKSFDSDVYEWIYKKAKFSSISINRAYLDIENIRSGNLDEKIMQNLFADGELDDVELKIEDGLSVMKSKKVSVSFDKGTLGFKTENASYEGVIADKVSVDISGFYAKQTLLKLKIESKNAILDSRILKLLKFYDIELPILQKNGKTSGFINLDILLPSGKLETKVTPKGFYHITNADVELGGVEFHTDKANISIENNFVFVTDSNARYGDLADIDINLSVDTNKSEILATLTPKKLKFDSGDNEIVNFGSKGIFTKINFGDKITANIPQYDINLTTDSTQDSATIININDISKLSKILPILPNSGITNGKLNIKIKDFSDISMSGELQNLAYPVYNLDGSAISRLRIKGEMKNDIITLGDAWNRVKILVNTNTGEITINAKNAMINISEFLESKIPIIANALNDEKNADSNPKVSTQDSKPAIKATQNQSPSVKVEAADVLINLFGYNVALQKAYLTTTQEGFIANGYNKNGVAKIISNNGTINVEADNFNDAFINTLFGKGIVSGGTFSLVGKYRDGKFIGEVGMLSTSVQNMATLQNIITLIDTIPSLITFKLPGFSASGYEIDNAKIVMGLNSELVAFESISINGSSVDIEGKGIVDLTKQELNIELQLSTMKSLSSVLNKIPIIGYLILGDDGKITTDLSVTGSLDNPNTELSLLKDAANAPVNILKRVFEPFKILSDELKNEQRNRTNK